MSFLKGTPKEAGTVIIRHDSGYLEFREFDMENESVLEKDNNGIAKRAWPWKFDLIKDFSLPNSDETKKALLVFDRDIVFDPFEELPNNDPAKPQTENTRITTVARIANKTAQQHAQETPGIIYNRGILFLGVTMFILAIGLALKAGLG